MPSIPDALHGCKLFPCIPGGKVPATEDGWKEATDDSAVIAEWERINPTFNWAVACGLSGLFVLDIDPEGLGWWSELLRLNTDISKAVDNTLQVRTPRGGLHIYFRGEGPSTASRIAPGVDTRGGIWRDGKLVSGGYVVLPGSTTKDGAYSLLRAGPILALPDCVRLLVPERKQSETHGLERDPDKDQPRNVAWAVDLLTGYVTSGRVSVEGKGGNNTAFQVAASILDKAISPAMCFDLMVEHWNPHCQPPWEDWELETVIRNAAAYGEDTGGGVKGFQANEAAFGNFVGQEFEEPQSKLPRDKLQWLHVYAGNVQDPTWLIPGMLPATGTGMIYGPSGSYKSFLALDMALCLAYGRPGQWGAPPVKNDVLFLAGEGPIATAKKRWPAWLAWQNVTDPDDHRFIIKNRVPFYTDTEGWEHVKTDLAELGAKPSLIVIDTLTRLLTGMDENSAKDATMITSFMEDLARYFECFVLAIHHEGKDGNRGARGSSAFFANMDAVISTRRKVGGTEVRVRKQKDADVPDEPNFFQVKEFADSIVLEQIDALPEEPKAGKSRHDWASPAEVVKVLSENGGRLSNAMMVRAIADTNGLDPTLVQKKIMRAPDLQWLRVDSNTWAIEVDQPREYDL